MCLLQLTAFAEPCCRYSVLSTLFSGPVCTGKPLPPQPPAPETLGVDKSKTPKWEVVVRVHHISLIMEKLPPVGYSCLGSGPDLGTVSLFHCHLLSSQAMCLVLCWLLCASLHVKLSLLHLSRLHTVKACQGDQHAHMACCCVGEDAGSAGQGRQVPLRLTGRGGIIQRPGNSRQAPCAAHATAFVDHHHHT